ncbi:MAG: hypothetical protein KC613_17540, partial [Myxococcales bacterium]|nr:hypothetical protein [Myxococcales bacterium]
PDGCPESWPVGAADADGAGGWVLAGELAAEGPLTAAASCTDGPAFAVGVFRAPAAGRYGFSLIEGPPGARIFARTACALPAPRFEAGCGTDLQVFLRQDEALAVWAAGAPGPFAVTVQREEGE